MLKLMKEGFVVHTVSRNLQKRQKWRKMPKNMILKVFDFHSNFHQTFVTFCNEA